MINKTSNIFFHKKLICIWLLSHLNYHPPKYVFIWSRQVKWYHEKNPLLYWWWWGCAVGGEKQQKVLCQIIWQVECLWWWGFSRALGYIAVKRWLAEDFVEYIYGKKVSFLLLGEGDSSNLVNNPDLYLYEWVELHKFR